MTRDELIRRLRRLARARRVTFAVDRKRGKGGHWIVTFGERWQPVPQAKGRDLPTGLLRSILAELGLRPEELE